MVSSYQKNVSPYVWYLFNVYWNGCPKILREIFGLFLAFDNLFSLK